MKTDTPSVSISRRRAIGLAALSALFVTGICGCDKTPQEAVLGRWYNGDMSLRLRKNGTVVWNTPQGLAEGRYAFVGQVPRWATENSKVQLQLDVTRNGKTVQPTLEMTFVGSDRVRVVPVTQVVASATNRPQALLRRATSEADGNDQTPATSRRATAGVRGIR